MSPNLTNCFIILMCTTSRPIDIVSLREVDRRPRNDSRSTYRGVGVKMGVERGMKRENEKKREERGNTHKPSLIKHVLFSI
jgi:hypothetical protein